MTYQFVVRHISRQGEVIRKIEAFGDMDILLFHQFNRPQGTVRTTVDIAVPVVPADIPMPSAKRIPVDSQN